MPKYAKEFVINQILSLANPSVSEKPLMEKLNLKRTTLEYYLNMLEKEGFLSRIPKTRPVFWEITNSGKAQRELCQNLSLSVNKKDLRLHNFSIEIPIIKDTSTGFWEKSWKLNGWKKQFKRLQHIGVSVERTPKTLTINLQPQEIREENLSGMIFSVVMAVGGYLAKEGIELDFWGLRVSRQEYGSPEELVRAQVEKGMTYRQSLGRPQEKIMANDVPKEAFVWFDKSKGPERDTNDLAHMRKTAMMPEKIDRMETFLNGLQPFLGAYTEQIKVHLEVMNGISRMVKKLNNRLDQKNLKEFL